MMNGFDIEQVHFGDVQSRRNFRLAMAGERDHGGLFPIVIINGSRPMCGKTALAREILNRRFDSAHADKMALSRAAWYGMIFEAKKRGYLFLDDLESIPVDVLKWLINPGYTLRKLGAKEYSTVSTRDIQVIVTGNNLNVYSAISSWSLVIQLE